MRDLAEALRPWLEGRPSDEVKVAQELARHSTPVLTIGRYAHTRLHDLQGALDSLPSLDPAGDAPEAQAMRATGTDDAAAIRDTPNKGQ